MQQSSTAASRLAWPFWNASQRRLRAGWRLLLHLLLLIAIGAPLAFVFRRVAEYFPISEGPAAELTGALLQTLALLSSIWLAGRLLDRRPMSGFGFCGGPRFWRDLLIGAAIGAGLQVLIAATFLAAGWATMQRPPALHALSAVAVAALLHAGVSLSEEALVRGYWLRNLAEGFAGLGRATAVTLALLLTSGLFGSMHMSNDNASLIAGANIALAGVMLGLCCVLTGRLGLPIGLHWAWNVTQGAVLGMPVSGHVPAESLVRMQVDGPPLWTGGAFGPEAGVISVILLAVVTLGLLAYARRSPIARAAALTFAAPVAEAARDRLATPPQQPDNPIIPESPHHAKAEHSDHGRQWRDGSRAD